MGKCNSSEATNINPNLNDQKFRLNEIEQYFIAEIKERELISKRLSRYVASFDYFNKSLIALSAASGSISIASFATITEALAGIANASFGLAFSMSIGVTKNFLKTTRNKMKKHSKIIISARSKLNSIESKTSKALLNNEISHEDFMIIINKKINYRESEALE